ncbi:MAG: tRNA (adenine-N1)-methyltransferase [Thaumarchaeota archaeon]|nr:tRNA (adenine-N1)-methyltransferase [Nitrososphaerota archaeon]
METIKEDSFILVYRDRRRKWLVRPMDTPKLHTHLGILDCKSLVGKPYGILAVTTMNDTLYILKPTLEDIVMKFARRTQVIYPKDLAMIVIRCGIHPGSRVFEAGTGSGAATATFASLVAPSGQVYSYDVNPEFQNIARKNLEKFGLMGVITLKNKDAKEGIDERDLDAALIDMGDPWELVANVKKALAPSAMMAAICPTMNQAERLTAKMKEEGFVNVESMEVLVRNLEARTGMTRPSQIMVAHTCYLTFGRKTEGVAATHEEPPEEPATEEEKPAAETS